MEVTSWNNWVTRINTSTIAEIDSEIQTIETDTATPYVEKELKLGYLYYSKDYLGTAAKIYRSLIDTIKAEKNNFKFISENEKGLNILFMGYRVVPDGCGGFEIIEESCCGSFCGPICACLGIVTVMAICKVDVDDICPRDSSGTPTCPCLDTVCEGCCSWYR